MPHTLEFEFPLPNGLHARPASHLVGAVGRFQAAATLLNPRTARSANARSVLALVATDTRQGDRCRLEFSGPDAAAAVTALRRFLEDDFVRCDEPLAIAPATVAAVLVPRSLRAAGLDTFHVGQVACRGLARGRVVRAGGFVIPPRIAGERAQESAVELKRFEHAARAVALALQAAMRHASALEAGVLGAHLAILNDPVLAESAAAAIHRGRSAAQAIADMVTAQRDILLAAEQSYIRERVLDVEDIATRLWRELYGADTATPSPELTGPSVVLAESMTPGQFLALDRAHLRGLVLAHAGQTSHAVILARSFGIPTLTGVANLASVARTGAEAIVDANVGILVPAPAESVRQFYLREEAKAARLAAGLAAVRDRPAASAGGSRRLEMGANIASVDEARAAFAQGAEGIGLFRTELLFADRTVAPDEDEQYGLYAAVVAAAGGRPVIIRTLDIGGDKPVPFLTFPAEANPFLGYRGVRFYAEQSALVKTQLRALLRASAHGPLKILVPMVAVVEEARLVRRLLEEARAELAQKALPCADAVPLGFMLEVPSVAFILDELCAEADFFSIGTNDLAQYFFAADRENAKVSAVNDPLQPGFLRLLQHLVSGVRARGRWVGLCGELADNPAALPLLLALGLDEISLAAPRIPATKLALSRLNARACGEFLHSVLTATTRAEVRAWLATPPVEPVPLLSADLVLPAVDAATKEEAIRALVDELHVAGRTADPAAVEEAIWRREDTYSTGFGDGFALPHCQTDALTANTIAVARLRTPVEWHAMDGRPVDLVILLGIRASEHGKAHMQTLARLSRLMMRDEFRTAMRRESDPAAVVALLSQASRPLESSAA